MPIEINYNYFARRGIEIDINSGYRVAYIAYTYGWRPKVVYIFVAEDDNSPISKIIRYIALRGKLLSLHEADVSEALAQQIDECLLRLPRPKPAIVDYLPILLAYLHRGYSVELGARYNNISCWKDYGGANFVFEYRTQYDIFYKNLHVIIDLCEELTGNKNYLRHHLEGAVEHFQDVFWGKGKYRKYRKRLRRFPKSELNHDYRQYHRYLTEFQHENLENDELRSIDFRHGLHGFLWRVAFEDTDRIGRHTIDPMLVFQKIGETDVLSWDDDEREALIAYFDALRDYILTYYPPLSIDMYTFVHGVMATGLDVVPYIQHWKRQFHRIEVSRHMAGYVQALYQAYGEHGDSAFDEVPRILRRWLRELAEGEYFLKRFMEYDGVRPFAHKFADASDTLGVLIVADL